MKRILFFSLVALTGWSCSKSATAKTTGHLYVTIHWQHSSIPAYWKVDLLTQNGSFIKSATTASLSTNVDLGELIPGSYYIDGSGDDNNGNPSYTTAKPTLVNITANNDQTITLTF